MDGRELGTASMNLIETTGRRRSATRPEHRRSHLLLLFATEAALTAARTAIRMLEIAVQGTPQNPRDKVSSMSTALVPVSSQALAVCAESAGRVQLPV
jgi:hypothetical protein